MSAEVTSQNWRLNLSNRDLMLKYFKINYKMAPKDQPEQKSRTRAVTCMAPGCSNSFYKINDRQRPVHFHKLPLKCCRLSPPPAPPQSSVIICLSPLRLVSSSKASAIGFDVQNLHVCFILRHFPVRNLRVPL